MSLNKRIKKIEKDLEEISQKSENKEILSLIKKLRIEKGLTLTELGEIIGYSNPYLSQVETGKRGKPSPDMLRKLSLLYDYPYLSLIVVAGYVTESDISHYIKMNERI